MAKEKVCDGCFKWMLFKEKCNIHWPDKQLCTEWQSTPEHKIEIKRINGYYDEL